MTLTLLNEWLAKQSQSMIEAKRRGLVPQTGDWEHPYRWIKPEDVKEIEAPKQLSTSTLVEGYVQDTETGRTNIVPRKSKNEGGGPPTHLYRVMDKRQYDDAVKVGKLKPAPDGDGRIYAAGKPSFQYAEPSPTVLVAIEYSDDDGWKAQSGLSEVTATTENPIPISKVKVVAEGANKRELLANYALVADKINEESIEKAVTTESIAEAKRKGLVPQSGDWQKPNRWIKPEDAKEIEVPEVPKSLLEIARDNQGKQAAEIEAMNLVSPQDITDGGYSNVIKFSDAEKLEKPTLINRGYTDDLGNPIPEEDKVTPENLYQKAKNLHLEDDDTITVWHGTTGKGATGILTDGEIHVAKTGGGFGVGFNMSLGAAGHWSGGRQVGAEKKHLYDKLGMIIQFELPVKLLENIHGDQESSGNAYTLGNKKEDGTFPSFVLDLETTKILYNDDPDNPAPTVVFNLLGKPGVDKELSGVPKNLLKESAPAIEKSVSTEDISNAKRRGLVPQSGDWMRPKRWIKPEDVKEIAISDTDFIFNEDGDKFAFGGGITGPIDLTEQISPVDLFGDEISAMHRGVWGDIPRYWYHRPPPHPENLDSKPLIEGAKDGGIKSYLPKKGEEASVHYSVRQERPEVVWVSPQPWGREGEETSIKSERLQGLDFLGKVTRVIDITKIDPNSFSSIDSARGQIVGDIPIGAIVDPKRSTDKSSSYQMPKYDMSWEALIESRDNYGNRKFEDFNFIDITDSMRNPESIGSRNIKDTDKVILYTDAGLYFGESEEDVKNQMLQNYISPEGKRTGEYNPPRLTPKPEWATDESDPFPEIPSDIKEIHYDDLPEFYSNKQFGEPLELGDTKRFKGKLKLIVERASTKEDFNSEVFSDAFIFDEDGENIDYVESAEAIANKLNFKKSGSTNIKVTAGEAKSVAHQSREQTQQSLIHRGLPEKFYVFRGGRYSDNNAVPTSLSPRAAVDFSQTQREPYIAMYEVSREDVLLDVNSMRMRSGTYKAGEDEHELVIQGKHLKNPRMIRLPNQMVDNPKFHKSKSLEKAVSTESIAEAKRKGLVPQSGDWLRPKRWIRPEDSDVAVDSVVSSFYTADEVREKIVPSVERSSIWDDESNRFKRYQTQEEDTAYWEDMYSRYPNQKEEWDAIRDNTVMEFILTPQMVQRREEYIETILATFNGEGRENPFRWGEKKIPKRHIDKVRGFNLVHNPSEDYIDPNYNDGKAFKAAGSVHVDPSNHRHHIINLFNVDAKDISYSLEVMQTIAHEVGHCVSSEYQQYRPWIWAKIDNAYKQASENYRRGRLGEQGYSYDLKSTNHSQQSYTVIEAMKDKERGFLLDKFVSDYSRRNLNEFFAECYASYITNTDLLRNRNPEMYEIIDLLARTPEEELDYRLVTPEDLTRDEQFNQYPTIVKEAVHKYHRQFSNTMKMAAYVASFGKESWEKDDEEYVSAKKSYESDIQSLAEDRAKIESAVTRAVVRGYTFDDFKAGGLLPNELWGRTIDSHEYELLDDNLPTWQISRFKSGPVRPPFRYEGEWEWVPTSTIVRDIFANEEAKYDPAKVQELRGTESWTHWFGAEGIHRNPKYSITKQQSDFNVDDFWSRLTEDSLTIHDSEEAGQFFIFDENDESLEKQAVATSEPPDLSVAARMKARGLEWKKETHRWIRPEEIEEEKEPQIHELSGDRDEFFYALMERFLDKKISTEDLTEEQKIYLSDIIHSMDVKADYLSSYISGVAAFPDTQWHGVALNIRSSLDTKTYAQFRVSALDAVVDAGFKVDLDSSLNDDDLEEITKLVIRPYMISQLSELSDKIQKTIEETDFSTSAYTDSSPDGQRDKRDALDKLLSPINERIKEMSLVKYPISTSPQDLVDLYVDGVLDINGRYDRKALNDSLIYSIEMFTDREELDKVLKFSRDNLFKLVTSGDRIGVNNIVSKVYDDSSPKDKEFMREALLNSFKDEDLVSLIHMNFVSGGSDTSTETKDVLAGVNHLTLAIYADMLKNGDIDDLAKFFSDENIPTGLLDQQEYSSLPFHLLSEHVSVSEFGSHVDTFLSSGEVLRKAGIEALSYIDPNHPSLLAMIATEENPYVIRHLSTNLPVTSLEDLNNQAQKIWDTIDVENLYQEAMDSYAKEHGMDDEFLPPTPDDVGYEEYRERRGEQIAYAEKSVALMRHSRKDLERSTLKVENRLYKLQTVDFDMESVEAFQSIFKKSLTTATTEQSYLPGMEPGEDEPILEAGQSLFDEWVNNLPDDFLDIVEVGFSDDYHKPGLPELFDELYYGTLFGKMHKVSKGAWESSSSSPWGGVLKESVGRQFDDKVIFHADRKTISSIDEALERERNMLFKPDTISSANFNQENLDKYVRMHKDMTRALLDKVIDGDTIEVFRGTTANELSKGQMSILESDHFSPANIQSNSLSSYSLNENTAEEHFATSEDSIVIQVPELHKDNIWSTFLSHSYEGGEREILVINHSDMDAYVKLMEEPEEDDEDEDDEEYIDTSEFHPQVMGMDSIEDIYGTGQTPNEYVEEFGTKTLLADWIESQIYNGKIWQLEDYLNSSYYDSSEVKDWASSAAQQLLEDAKQNYNYTYYITREQEEAINAITDMGFMQDVGTSDGNINKPDDILDYFNNKSDLAQTIFDILQEEVMGLEYEEDEEQYREEIESYDSEKNKTVANELARLTWEWAIEGQEKVSGI